MGEKVGLSKKFNQKTQKANMMSHMLRVWLITLI